MPSTGLGIRGSIARSLSVVIVAITIAAAGAISATQQQAVGGPRIEIVFAREARAAPVTGMVYVAIGRDNERSPIEEAGPTGVPLFSKFVEGLAPGTAATIGSADRGHPLASLRDLPAGEYWMQPFVNVYTRFPRADGKTVWLHNDQWEGQDWKRSPGNIVGDPVKVAFDPKSATPIRLVARKAIPAIQPPADTAMVKRIRIQSSILTKWWGQPIYLGATVLLPKDYDKHPQVRYPVNYVHGHFSLDAPGGFGSDPTFDRLWLAQNTPRFLYVTMQHPSPYYDDSYGVNSENNGPYGDAILQELIPAVEQKFRAIREPWARMLSGTSTGGWIAAAQLVFHPDFYGGSFASCPDPVNFSYHQIVDVYNDTNVYFFDKGWMKVERPNERQTDGNIVSMMKDDNWYAARRRRQITVGRPVGHLGGHVLAGRPRRLSEAPVEQGDRRDRPKRRAAVEEVRPAAHSQEPLGVARTEAGAQAQCVRGRHGFVLPEQRGREPQRVPCERGQPEVHRRSGVPAPRAALLGAERGRPVAEDDGADRASRSCRGGLEGVAIPLNQIS